MKTKFNELIKLKTFKLLACAVLSFFWVAFIWDFWREGIYALGFNFFIFLLSLFGLFIWVLYEKGKFLKSDLIWIVPFLLIILSFLIYDNPFLKVVSILVSPALFALFYNYAFLDDKNLRHWDIKLFSKILKRSFSFLGKIGESISSFSELIIPTRAGKGKIITKILSGIILLLIISITIFIPLLSSADAIFASKVKFFYDWFYEIISLSFAYKFIVFIILSVVSSSMLVAWGKRFDYEVKDGEEEKIDSIISGIVLGGISVIYFLFLWVQIERLWVGALPFDFKEAESLVKSGFWQLLFLSIINIVIYFFSYRKTVPVVQKILSTFTMASFLLLSSAGYRMGLYVTYYGFSYEKFFASYTVIFCAIVFIWLISRMFVKKRSNIIKFLVILFIWMYSLLTVFPVEQFILRANVGLSRFTWSRVNLYELSMLSPDVLSLVKKYENNNLVTSLKSGDRFDWGKWTKRQDDRVTNKKWYERNLINVIYLLNNK